MGAVSGEDGDTCTLSGVNNYIDSADKLTESLLKSQLIWFR